MKAVLEKCH